MKALLKEYSQFNVFDKVSQLLKEKSQRSVGAAKAALGFKPKFPILIIPGLASSALECWSSSEKPNWVRERVWIDPFKIGKTAALQKLSNVLSRKKTVTKSVKKLELGHMGSGNYTSTTASTTITSSITSSTSSATSSILSSSGITSSSLSSSSGNGPHSINDSEYSPGDSPDDAAATSADRRLWLRHLLTADDGFSDPPGIKLRPVPGTFSFSFSLFLFLFLFLSFSFSLFLFLSLFLSALLSFPFLFLSYLFLLSSLLHPLPLPFLNSFSSYPSPTSISPLPLPC